MAIRSNGAPSRFFGTLPMNNPMAMQQAVINHQHQCPEIATEFSRKADRGPRPIDQASEPAPKSATEWSALVKEFALANDADLVGITPTREEYVYEGYAIPHPNLIMIGVAMDHPTLALAPSTIGDMRSAVEVAQKYNKAARAVRYLANFILGSGYQAKTFPGPMATALNMIPAAIAAGLGELGKHGSMINRRFGVVCHEHRRSTRRCATIREMKEGPSGSAIRS